jgi:hypothetical protein
MQRIKSFSVVFLALLLSSCISRIDVRKVNNADINATTKAKGVRYSLPQPFVIGTPGLNGKVSYRVEYLPDPDNEYAVNAWSFMAKHKLKLGRSSNGMLKTVNYTQDDTVVPSALVESAGNFAEAQIKAMAAAKKPSGNDGGQNDQSTAEAPHVNTSAEGPVIYRVVEDPRFGVRLEPVSFKATLNGGALTREQQRRFETTGSPDPIAQTAGAKPVLKSDKDVTVKKSMLASGDPFFSVTFDMKVNKEGFTLTQSSGNKDRTTWCSIELDNSDKATVTLTKADIVTGDYKLEIVVSNAKDKTAKAKIPIIVHVDN